MKLIPLILLFFTFGCAVAAPVKSVNVVEEPPKQIEFSLFKSDSDVISDEAIQKVLSGELIIPEQVRVAVFKLPSRYGNFFWWAEDFFKMEQDHLEAVSGKLGNSGRVKRVQLFPSLITPKDATLANLRESAARLQADMLLVFQVKSNIHREYKLLRKDKAKAYSTCEALLLDVRTGIIPFTTIITREAISEQEGSDLDFNEVMKRAEKAAAISSINALGEQLSEFFGK